MATTKQAAPAKKSEGFQGVRGAFWIIVVCAIIAFTLSRIQVYRITQQTFGVQSTKVVLSYLLSTLCCSLYWQ